MRHLALEFLVSIVEASPAMCRKMPGRAVEGAGAMGGGGGAGTGGDNAFATNVIPVCFSMMTELPVRGCVYTVCVGVDVGRRIYSPLHSSVPARPYP